MRNQGWLMILLLVLVLLLTGCDQFQMEDQPKWETYETAAASYGGHSALPTPEGTVAREDDIGPVPSQPPMTIDTVLLERGRERYDVFCAPCHDPVGDGNGLVVQRGFPAPPSFHSERLRNVNMSHIYHVITHGYGVMYPYNNRVQPQDRWAIAAYIKVLQLSQHAGVNDLPPGMTPQQLAASSDSELPTGEKLSAKETP